MVRGANVMSDGGVMRRAGVMTRPEGMTRSVVSRRISARVVAHSDAARRTAATVGTRREVHGDLGLSSRRCEQESEQEWERSHGQENPVVC